MSWLTIMIPYGGMVDHTNKISLQKCKFGVDFWEYIVIQYGQSRMTRTERQQDEQPRGKSENAICRVCTDSVVEELRAPHSANATGNGFTTNW